MSKFPFLRRPVRLILYAALLALVTTATLIFAWQYLLDGIILEHAIDTYAYVGTIVRSDGQILDYIGDRDLADEPPEMGGPAFLEVIPEELVRWLEESEHVARIDSRETLAALAGEYTRVKVEETSQTIKIPTGSSTGYFFLEATVTMVTDYFSGDPYAMDNYQLRVDKMWSDPEFSGERMIMTLDRHIDEEPLREGQRIFVLGGEVLMGDSGMASETQTWAMTPTITQIRMGEEYELNVFDQNRLSIIPDGVDSEQYIQELLETTGLDKHLERQLRTKYTLTVRQTQDMSMIPLFAMGKAMVYEGRGLYSADMGKKVCVINSALAQRNRLSVGDTIKLSVADGCYTADNGHESGEPGVDDTMLEYREYEEYEVVGTYTQKIRRGNYLEFSYNDIFVPADDDTAAAVARPYTFSFRVPGPEYVEFLAQFEPVLEGYGYSLVMEDTGWDDVKESFYTMQTRRQLMLLCAAAAFMAAVLVFAVLLNAHCRYEYGLRRLMGASKREAAGIYGGVFLFTGVPGAMLAVGGAWLMAVRLMKDALASDALLILPTDAQCAGTLAIWAALELAAVLGVLFLLAWRGEKRGLLGLIRR